MLKKMTPYKILLFYDKNLILKVLKTNEVIVRSLSRNFFFLFVFFAYLRLFIYLIFLFSLTKYNFIFIL